MRGLHVLMTWLALAGCAMVGTAVGCQRPVVDVERAPASGAVVLHGQLGTDAPVVSPSGASGAAWEAWVKTASPHGFPQLACADRDGSHLLLTSGGEKVRVDETFLAWDMSEGVSPGPAIDVRPRPGHPAAMPSAFATHCGSVGSENLGPYVEIVLPVGAEVFVSGCLEAHRIVPCHDGADSITSTLPPPMLGARRHDWGRISAVIALAGVAALGLSLLVERRRVKARQ
jgi:hypothetical protein